MSWLLYMVDFACHQRQPVLKISSVLERHIGQNKSRKQGLNRGKPDKSADEQRGKTEYKSGLNICNQNRNKQNNCNDCKNRRTQPEKLHWFIIPV